VLLAGQWACGSLTAQEQYISVDSEPRGVLVTSQAGLKQGRTPFFKKTRRQRALSFRYLGAHGPVDVTQSCGYRWIGSPLENGVMGLSGLLVAGPIGGALTWASASAIDLWTGASYACPLSIRLSAATQSTTICERHALRLPQSVSQSGRKVLRDWWQTEMKSLNRCVSVVEEDITDLWIRKLSLEFSRLDRLKARRERVNRFGFESGATHVVDMETNRSETSKALVLKVKVVDLHHLDEVDMPAVSLPDGVVEDDTGGRMLGFFRESLFLIPETFALAAHRRTIERGFDQPDIEVGPFPSIRIMRVSHPDSFAPWDVDLGFEPGVGLDLFQELSAGKKLDASAEFSRLAVHALGRLTFHTPVGAFSAEVGVGGAYFYLPGTAFKDENEFGTESVLRLSYTAFLTDSVLFRAYRERVFVSADVAGGYFAEIEDSGFLVGYYFEGLDEWTRNLF